MPRMLRMALEGETVEVVDGMFVAVPLGEARAEQETLAALEQLDEALGEIDEACQVGEVQQYLLGQTPTEGAVAVESVKEKVKLVLKKIWALIAKVLAACMALQRGFVEWLRKGGKRRPLHREVYKAWLDLSVLLRDGLGLWGDKEKMAKDLFENVIKADSLDKLFGSNLNSIQRDMLVKGPYTGAIQSLIGVVCEKDLSNNLRGIATGIGEDYTGLQQQAHKVDASNGHTPPGPGTGKDIVPFTRESLERFTKEVDSVMRLSDSRTETILGDLTHAKEKATQAKGSASQEQLPRDIDKALHIAMDLGRDMPYELALRYRDEYIKMFEDTERSLKAAEARFTKPGDFIDDNTIEGEGLPAQTYLDRATLEAVRSFGKAIQNVASSYAMIEEHFDSAVTLTETLFDYVIRVLKTFGEDFMADRDARFVGQVMKLERDKKAVIERMNRMKGKK